MKNSINVFICGMGNLGKQIAKYAVNKNCKIIGMYDINIEKIDLKEKYFYNSIKINNISELKKVLSVLRPDICITTISYLLEMDKEICFICADLGIDLITTCEEAFFSENSNRRLTEEIDEKAKKNHCTIVGTGYQDIYWGQLVSVLASSTNIIKTIKGNSIYDIDCCNKEINENHGVGLEKWEYDKKIKARDLSKEFIPSFMWNANGWICSKLNLKPIKYIQTREPVIAKKEIYSNGLKKLIHIGQVIGTNTMVETKTKEGITILTSTIGKIFNKNNKSQTIWKLEGNPNVKIRLDSISGLDLTASIVVNRIPDVINSKPGFLTTNKLEELIYRKNNLEKYIKKEEI